MAVEEYAFITNENHDLYAADKWPYAIPVGDNYKMVQFSSDDKSSLIEWSESLGFTVKNFSGDETIEKMKQVSPGPFLCDHKAASEVVYYFNPPKTEV